MGAAYDSFDYPSYWIGRDYEHKSEIRTIKEFLGRVNKIKTILEIGAGFGRLAPTYAFRSKKVILSDPSARTLKIARKSFDKNRNFKFIHASIETLPKKIRSGSADVIVMVRVLHHLKDIHKAFKIINKLLTPGGYLIFEFANKRHLKASIRNIFKGNFSFISDMSTTDIRSLKSVRKGTLPFLNYHPEKIKAVLSQFGFEVIEKRSVSNIRSTLLKKLFSVELLLFLESKTEWLFSFFDLGPSIFVLARKKG